jgi:hypothetical protein
MNLKLLQDLLNDFQNWQLAQPELESHFHWECLKNFQDNWELEAPDLQAMYNSSLQSQLSRQLWKKEQYFPKEMMLAFIPLQPDFVRDGFRDLLNENKSVDGRMGRFLFYCDQLLEEYKRVNPTSVTNNHYHGDYYMIALYLAFSYPEMYCLYDPEGFRCFLEKVKAPNPPVTHDLERYFKVSRTVGKFLDRKQALQDYYRHQLKAEMYYSGKTLLPVYQFYRYLSSF